MSIQDGDKFLVCRNNTSYSIDSENLVANIEDTDLMLVTRSNVAYKVTGEEVKASLGGGGSSINPSPDDISADPPLSGTGTEEDPFVFPSVTAAPAGQTATSQQFTISDQTPNTNVVFTNQSDSTRATGNRFNQPTGQTDSDGNWTGSLQYADTPDSTEDTTYVGKFKIGSVYLQWTVEQKIAESSVAPVLTSVSLVESNPQADPRFTDQSFVASSSLSEEGTPVSTKTFNAFVEGKITTKAQFEEPLESSTSGGASYEATYSNANQRDGFVPERCLDGDADSAWIFDRTSQSFSGTITFTTPIAHGGQFEFYVNPIYPATYGYAVVLEDGQTYSQTYDTTSGFKYYNIPFNGNTSPIKSFSISTSDSTSSAVKLAGVRVDGVNLLVVGPTSEPTLTFASDTDMQYLAAGDEVSQQGPEVNLSNNLTGNFRPNAGGANFGPTSAFDGDLTTGAQSNGSNVRLRYEFGRVLTGSDVFSYYTENGNTQLLFQVENGTVNSQERPDAGQWSDYTGLTNITAFEAQASSGNVIINAMKLNGELLLDSDGLSTGTVDSITDTTVTLSASSGTWVDDEDVTGPEKTIVLESAKKHLEFDSSGAVSGLLDNPQDPSYTTTDANPGLTLTFPATFPSGQTPDEELGEGVTLTVEVTASNDAGSSGPLSAEVQPEGAPPEPEPPTDLDKAKAGLTTLYSGNGTSQSIVNDIDFVNNDGLVWIKSRTTNYTHRLFDTLRGAESNLSTTNRDISSNDSSTLQSFANNGWTLGSSLNVNGDSTNYVAWSFPKSAGYFDVVQYSGAGSSPNAVNHNLAADPGMIICKPTNAEGSWMVWHKDLPASPNAGSSPWVVLNDTDSRSFGPVSDPYPISNVTDTSFTVTYSGTFDSNSVNKGGQQYIAYLWAADTANVIKCGTYNGNNTTNNVATGFDTQWVLIKNTTTRSNWSIYDDKRGANAALNPNLSTTENNVPCTLSSTGFTVTGGSDAVNALGNQYIYVAIAAPPPPEPPADALNGLTSLYRGNDTTNEITNGINLVNNAGLVWMKSRTSTGSHMLYDTIRGPESALRTNRDNGSLDTSTDGLLSFNENGFTLGTNVDGENQSGQNEVAWTFQKAEGYFDVVTWDKTQSSDNRIAHNLKTKPGFIITKAKAGTQDWFCWHSTFGQDLDKWILLNSSDAVSDAFNVFGASAPTDTDFGYNDINAGSEETVAYLFAEYTPNVIKCGDFNTPSSGTTESVNVGFKPQWLLYKRTNGTQAWTLKDNKREDNLYPNLNSVEAGDYVTFTDTGFDYQVGQLGTNGAYIYVAIAEPPESRSLTQSELGEQRLKFATYQNRKDVIEGQNAMSKRDDLMQELKQAGVSQEQIDNLMG